MFNRTISVSILCCCFSCNFQVFPRSSPLALNISEAIIYLEQSGELQKLEEQMLSFPKCSTSTSDVTGIRRIGPGTFSNLFINYIWNFYHCIVCCRFSSTEKALEGMTFIQSMLMVRGLWMWLAAFFTKYKNSYDLELSREIKL